MDARTELLDHLEHHHLIERSWLDSNCTDPEGFHLRCHARGEAMGETGLDCNRDHASDDLTPRGEQVVTVEAATHDPFATLCYRAPDEGVALSCCGLEWWIGESATGRDQLLEFAAHLAGGATS